MFFTGAITICAVRVFAQPCADVTRFDFENSEFRIGAHTDDSHHQEQSIRLRNGTGFISDNPISMKSRDWEVTLKVDRAVRVDTSMWAKVIVLDQNHLTGTGDWRYILVFGCAHGSLVRLFQHASEGMALQHTDGQTIRLYQPRWKSSDAHCCPSQHLELLYEWDVREHRYRLKASILRDGFDLPKDEN